MNKVYDLKVFNVLIKWAISQKTTLIFEGSPIISGKTYTTQINNIIADMGYLKKKEYPGISMFEKKYTDITDIPTLSFEELKISILNISKSIEHSFNFSSIVNDNNKLINDFLNNISDDQFNKLTNQNILLSISEVTNKQKNILMEMINNLVFGETLQSLKITLALADKIEQGVFEIDKQNNFSMKWFWKNKDRSEHNATLPLNNFIQNSKLSENFKKNQIGSSFINITLEELSKMMGDNYIIEPALYSKRITILNFNSNYKDKIFSCVSEIFKLKLQRFNETQKISVDSKLLKLSHLRFREGILKLLPYPISNYLTQNIYFPSETNDYEREVCRRLDNLTSICYRIFRESMPISISGKDVNDYQKMLVLLHLMKKNIDLLKNIRNTELIENFNDIKLYGSKYRSMIIVNFLFPDINNDVIYDKNGNRAFDIRFGISGSRK